MSDYDRLAVIGNAESLFLLHDRHWEQNRFVYPVVSRRSGGLSIGINLNPDKRCNFDCVYCSVDRSVTSWDQRLDLHVVRDELTELLQLAQSGQIWTHPPFDRADPSLRRLNDIAFSGDGEPTSCLQFADACTLVIDLLTQRNAADVKIVLITNATLLHQPRVKIALNILDHYLSEIWAKLDAGTEAYYHQVERTKVPFERVLNNIRDVGQSRAIVIQSLFMRIDGDPPSDTEINAYLTRIETLVDQGCQINRVQVYTVARKTAESSVTPLDAHALDQITQRVRGLGLHADAFYAPDALIDEASTPLDFKLRLS